MKKIFFFLLVYLTFNNQCLAVPSNTMSVTPTAANATIIQASDENDRNNTITTTFNAHSHTDITQLGTVTTGVWNGTSIASQYVDDFNPQELTLATVQTEGAGTLTDIDFGAADTITVSIDGNQSVFLIFVASWENSDATGLIQLVITDNSNNIISGADMTPATKIAAEREVTTMTALDTRPASGTKTYKCRFQRNTAGTATIGRRIFTVYTFPDPA